MKDIQIGSYKKLQAQKIHLDKGINLLVGANGSGKSSLLELIFNNPKVSPIRVAYSSGVNESFSEIYRPYLETKIKRYKKVLFQYAEEIESSHSGSKEDHCYYFDKEWAPFLILAATFLKKGKLTSGWLTNFGLKLSSLSFTLKFDTTYRNKIKLAFQDNEESTIGFDTSKIHRFLNSLTNDFERLGFETSTDFIFPDSDTTFEGTNVLSTELNNYLFDSGIFGKSGSSRTLDANIAEFFDSLQVAASGSKPILPLKYVNLIFKNENGKEITLNSLSDGEYQLLTTSALLDLFGNKETIFLLDEIDAHIHPTLVREIWELLASVEGYIVTSSHNMMSLSITEMNRICFLENGIILNDFFKKKGVIDSLFGGFFTTPVVNSLFYSCKNIIIMDGLDDWIIFKRLCEKQGKDFTEIEESSVFVSKNSSSTKPGGLVELFQPKIDWVNNFISSVKNLNLANDKIKLKNFILICDRDDVETSDQDELYYKGGNTRPVNRYVGKIHKIVWNRRCIENYLLSKAAREAYTPDLDQEYIKTHWKVRDSDITQYGQNKVLKSFLGYVKNHMAIFSDSEHYGEGTKRIMSCKAMIHSYVFDESGLNEQKLSNYISSMEKEDIDPYLLLVHRKLEGIVQET